MKNNKLILLLVVLIFFLCLSFKEIGHSFGVYRGVLNTKVYLTVLDPNSTYTITFYDPNSGTVIDTYAKTLNSTMGSLPTATRTDYNFTGWYTAASGGDKIHTSTVITGSATYYAQWAKIACKKATAGSLHTATCSTGGGCLTKGADNQPLFSSGTTITFGTLFGQNSPISGDAYTCDVNDDGVWDEAHERFYFIRDYIDGDDEARAALVFYTNFDQSGRVDTNSSDRQIYQHDPGLDYLPDSSGSWPTGDAWDNSALYEFNTKVSRYITLDDLTSACGTVEVETNGYLNDCYYFMEYSHFTGGSDGRSGIWVEMSGTQHYRIDTRYNKLAKVSGTSSNTVKPVIEVPFNTIEGYRDRELYTITLNTMGGLLNGSNTVDRYENQVVGSLPSPTRDGYEFMGWYTTSGYATAVNESDLVTSSATFYAKWAEYVEITLNLMGGTDTPTTIDRYVGQEYGTLPTPIRDGYEFAGWFTTDGYVTEIQSTDLVTGSATIFAKWDLYTGNMRYVFYIPGTCSINGSGSNITSASNDCYSTINHTSGTIDYTSNKYIDTHVSLYSEENYDKDYEVGFTIMNYDSATTVNPNRQATIFNAKLENVSLNYPGLAFRRNNMGLNYFEVTQTINGVRATSPNLTFTPPITSAAPIDVKIFREDGVIKYSFNGGSVTTLQNISGTYDYFNHYAWFGSAGTAVGSDATTSNAQAAKFAVITLSNMYIKLEDTSATTYTITFNGNGGTVSISPNQIAVASGASIGSASMPTATWTGHTFDGWYTESTGGTLVNGTEAIASSATYYAHWTQNTMYTITFNPGSGSVDPNSLSIASGSVISQSQLPTVTYPHHTFMGWYYDSEYQNQVDLSATISSSTTWYAKWEDNPTITFNPVGGSVSTSSTEITYGGTLSELPTATKTDNTFVGWYYDSNYENPVNMSATITSSATWYAKWSEIFRITLDPVNGTVDPTELIVGSGGTVDSLPTPERTGYTFINWYLEDTYNTIVDTSLPITSSATWYAKWEVNPTITFNPGSGSVDPNSVTITYGATLTQSQLPTVTYLHHTFMGWYYDSLYANAVDLSVSISSSTTWYAKWEDNPVITFDALGGSVSTSSTEITYGDTVTLPTVEWAHHEFLGWYEEDTFVNLINTAASITSSATWYAKWEEITTATITFDTQGGDQNVEPIVVNLGSPIGELPVPTKTDNKFVGWYTDSNFETEATEDTMVDNSATWYAYWTSASNVACVGTNCYTTVPLAVNSITSSATTVVKMISSATNPTSGTEILTRVYPTAGKNIILDLNGYVLSAAPNANLPVIENKATTLLITGGTIATSGSQGAVNNNLGSTLVIDSATIIATGIKQGVYNLGYAEIKNSYISAKSSNRAAVQSGTAANSGATTVILSGTIIQTSFNAIVNNCKTIIGVEDRSHDASQPVIQGKKYGLSGTNGSEVEFYDGIIMGGTATQAVDDESRFTSYEVNTKRVAGTQVVSGTTYQTLYREPDESYEVTLEVNGGTGVPASILVSQSGTIGELPTPTKDGYNFGGWYMESTFDTLVDESGTLTSSATFYAKWIEDISYTVNFNANGGTIVGVNSITYQSGATLGSNLPTAVKDDSTFVGWFTETTGGTIVTADTLVTSGTTYYAHFSSMVCKRATVLHQSGGTTYGQLPAGYELHAGDAFDCDVNGNGTYDSSTERFYYLTTDDDDNAVLIYYNNFSIAAGSSATCKPDGVSYGSPYASGPAIAYAELPDSTLWPNVSLHSVPRTIKYENGTGSNQFGYTDKVARLATFDEIKAATVSTLNGTANELSASQYSYLFENIGTGCRSNYWLETPRTSGGVWRMDSGSLRVGSGTGTSAVRPVIEVPLNLVEVDDEPVEFDIIPTAMRNYYNNISTWIVGQSDSVLDGSTIINNHTSFDTAMGNNLSSNNCVNFNGDNRESVTSGSVFCDQPNQYDTGVNGPVNVYEYDTDTQTVSSQIASYVSSDTGKLYNFIPNKTYYWEDASDSSVNGYVKPIGERRILTIANSPSNLSHRTRNVRDLGGIKVDVDRDGTIDGTIKYGKMFRGEKIWGGDGSSVQYFTKLGITHEIDLRESSEVVTNEEDKLTNYSLNSIIHYGIDYTSNNTDYWKSRNLAKTVMQNFVNSTDQNPYNIYFHCRIGADRTGTLAYILEGLLGATEEERYRDYELTVFFGLDERTRFYFNKTTNYTKFTYLKNVFKTAGGGTYEDVVAWFLQGSADTAEKCSDIALINSFRNKMIDATGTITPLTDSACSS